MKTFLLALTFCASALVSFSQSPATATFGKEKGTFYVKDNASFTKFMLSATAEQLKEMENVLAPMGHVVLETKLVKPNTYACTLQVNDTADEAYVAKIFAALRIEAFVVNGEKQTLDALPALLQSLK
jgi:hypothetical protein